MTRAAVIFMGYQRWRTERGACARDDCSTASIRSCTSSAARAVVDGRAALVECVEEFGEHRAVRVVGERHRIGAAAERRFLAERLAAPVVPVEVDLAGRQHRRAPRADDLDALGEARVARGRGVQRAERAVGKAQRRARDVFGFHPVQRRRCGKRGDLGNARRQRQEQVERVDRLRDQHAAAVACQRAAPRLVVIRLRPPPRNVHRCRGDVAELAVAQPLLRARARPGGNDAAARRRA